MDVNRLTSVLSQLQFTAPLAAEALEAIAGCSVESAFPPGQVIFREGDANAKFYLLVSGNVALDMYVPGRGSVRILSLGPGDMLAWSALLGGGLMTASATALEETRLVSIDAVCLHTLCESNPRVDSAEMMRAVYATPDYIETLSTSTAIADHVPVDFKLRRRWRRRGGTDALRQRRLRL